jgi:hypothetical protein
MLTRKQLPLYGKIEKSIDINRLIKYCVEQGYTDYNLFTDVQYGKNDKHGAFLQAHSYSKKNFFTEEAAEQLQGEKYKQLYLTEIKPDKVVSSLEEISATSTTMFSRNKRRLSTSSNYLPEADEHNYGHRNKHVKGVFEEIINQFASPVCRVRLAVLMPGFIIKPHVDYDPSYITRYHIPIITNEQVRFGGKIKERTTEYTMPADGSVYFFNSGHLHWVGNYGTEPRLHLIVDTNGQEDLKLTNES